MEFGKDPVESINSGLRRKQTGPYSDHGISFYTKPPEDRINLADAESMVAERLQILYAISAASEVAQNDKYFETLLDVLKAVKPPGREDNFIIEAFRVSQKEARKRDIASHYLLRLYFCRTDELRRWFIHNETELMKLRLWHQKTHLSSIIKANGFKYEAASEEENDAVPKDWMRIPIKQKVSFFKIPFEEAHELVKNRRVYLKDGYCFVESTSMISIVLRRFRIFLSKSLAETHLALPQMNEDSRLIPRFHALYSKFKPVKEKNDKGYSESVTPEEVEELSQKYFPPCMRGMHQKLKENHHLRHFGRLYYGLFLKGIGMSLDDCLIFFRGEFIKKMTPEQFQKGYAYSFRYMYGKEGKKVSLSPYSCNKIINENAPGPIDTHGCPFRHFDDTHLRIMLKKDSIPEEKIEEIVQIAKENKTTAACTAYFSCRYPENQLDEAGIYHPNQFYVRAKRNRIKREPEDQDTSQNSSMLDTSSLNASQIDPSLIGMEGFLDDDLTEDMHEDCSGEKGSESEIGGVQNSNLTTEIQNVTLDTDSKDNLESQTETTENNSEPGEAATQIKEAGQGDEVSEQPFRESSKKVNNESESMDVEPAHETCQKEEGGQGDAATMDDSTKTLTDES